MLKRIGLPLIAVMAMLMLFSAPQANAGVHFGVAVGPAYAYPAPYAYSYPYPYSYPYGGYVSPYAYPYYGPGYVAPSFGFGWYGHHDRGDWRYRGHEFREHGGGWHGGHEFHSGGHRR